MKTYEVTVVAENGDWIYHGEAVFDDGIENCEAACDQVDDCVRRSDFFQLESPNGRKVALIKSSSVMKVEVVEVEGGE